jgi:hypothetical protein
MKPIFILIAAIAFALSPFLLPEFGGFDPDLYPVPQDNPAVQPAGWAFAIWGIIYLGLIFHGSYGLIKRKADQSWDRGRISLLASLAIGAIWLPVAFVSPIWATILIWVMLIAVLISLYQTQTAAPKWAAAWPVALYAGWLTAASFVSIGLILAGYGFTGEVPAAIIALVLATPFAVININKLKHWTYGAAVSWGLIAIAANNWDSNTMLVWLSIVAAFLVIGTTVLRVRRAS